MERSLAVLRVENIPNGPFETWGETGRTALSDANEAVHDLVRICMTFREAPQSKLLARCAEQSYAILAECWGNIIPWLKFLVSHAPLNTLSVGLVCTCAQLLQIVASGVDSNDYQQEVMCRLSTVDFVYYLLCKVDPMSGYRYVAPLSDGPGEPCMILRLVDLYLSTSVLSKAFISRFTCFNKSRRDAIIDSFILRAEEMVPSASSIDVVATMKNLVLIVHNCCRLVVASGNRVSRQHKRVLFRYTSVLSACSKKACENAVSDKNFWTLVADGVGILVRGATTPIVLGGVLQLLEGGIMSSVVDCAPHITRPGSQEHLLSLVPFLYPRNGVRAAADRGDFDFWLHPLPEGTPAMSTQSIVYGTYKKALSHAVSVAETETVSICSNIKHQFDRVTGIPLSNARICGRCHTVAYCSPQCQEEDWAACHSRECRELAKRYRENRNTRSWPSLHRKCDVLSILLGYANSSLPSPTDLRSVEPSIIDYSSMGPPKSPRLRFKPTSSLAIFNYFFDPYAIDKDTAVIEVHERMGLQSHFNPYAWWADEDECAPWLPRYQKFIDEVEQNGDTMVLIEGRFRVYKDLVLLAFALMKYAVDAGEGHKYQVVCSIFRTFS
ncbi:hypothetical protein FA13DRAFT_1392800 [Coprinellus micaceus]|uniref:MYND-type domain-containing protein n=1 Tax=Coprinellus micaceus TaxID=71717 RepID=A0A4Y7SQ34_COPMI|nr:hypothetical protein FA13DRAFT_1392800 [Coprinellus micaceus]